MAEEISKKTVVYSLPGMASITVESDGVVDVYYPIDKSEAVVIVVAGYPEVGFERRVGCKFKDTGSSVSWSRLIAASGIAAVTYSHTDPIAGLHFVLDAVCERGFQRLGLWASSGNAPLALSMLMRDAPRRVASAALCYPYTLHVPAQAKKFGFATPADERSVDDLTADIPLLIARAGQDEMPGLNETLDRFVADALQRNLPITMLNHPTAPHAFDLVDDSAATRATIAQILAFLQANLQRE